MNMSEPLCHCLPDRPEEVEKQVCVVCVSLCSSFVCATVHEYKSPCLLWHVA